MASREKMCAFQVLEQLLFLSSASRMYQGMDMEASNLVGNSRASKLGFHLYSITDHLPVILSKFLTSLNLSFSSLRMGTKLPFL